jgi:hypothetical protein
VNHAFEVDYVRGLPREELEKQLRRIRLENDALIEKIRADMARELVKARRRSGQRRQLDVTVQPTASQSD